MIMLFLIGLAACCFMCLYRIGRGPISHDRTGAIDILGIAVAGFCAIIGIVTERSYFLDVAIAWSLLSFIGTIALAKFLEGRHFDE
ncbi:MAG: cation:proton antiporter [Planctomycetota bacterium]|jgi:multicomponent Na+:H+ antiporter subunit F